VVAAVGAQGECDAAREALRKKAQHTVTNDPNASALKVAAALGQLQARCVQRELPSDTAPPEAPDSATPAKPDSAKAPAPAPAKKP